MNLLPEPSGNSAQVPVFHIPVYIALLQPHLMQHLCSVGAAQSVGWEVSNQTAGPMGILQTPLSVIGHIHAQIFLVQPVPLAGNLRNRQRSVDQLLFDFIANHHMQTVGQLVSFRADQRRLCLVDGPVKGFLRNIRQLLREELPDFREYSVDERLASSDVILIEAALAFMETHGSAAGKGGVVVAVIRPQLVQGVAALVDYGEHGGNQIVLMVMGGDPHILVSEIGGVRVLRFRDAAVAAVKAHDLHQIIGKLPLHFHREMPVQEAVLDLRGLLYLPQQRHNCLANLCKERIRSRNGETLFILIQQRIIGRQLRIVVPRKLPVGSHNLLQIGRKRLEIILQLGLVPHGLGIIEQDGVFHIFLRGDFLGFLIGFLQNLRFPPGLRVQGFPVFLQEGEQLPVLRRDQQVIGCLGQHLHGLSPSLPCISGGRCGGVQIQDTHSVVIGKLLALECFQRLHRFFDAGVFHQR